MSLCSGSLHSCAWSPGMTNRKPQEWQSFLRPNTVGPGNRPTWVSADNVQQRGGRGRSSGQDPRRPALPGGGTSGQGAMWTRPSDQSDSP